MVSAPRTSVAYTGTGATLQPTSASSTPSSRNPPPLPPDGFGQRDAQEVGGRQLAPQRGVETDLTSLQFGQALRSGAGLEELASDLADGLLFFGEAEIHDVPVG